MSVRKGTVATAVGTAATLVCVAWFIRTLAASELGRLGELPRAELAAVILATTLLYAALLALVGIGFSELVRATGHRAATAQEGIAVWGRANLAKYLPGNVLHFAGRQVLARRFAWPQASTAAASVLELALQVLLSCAIGLAAFLVAERSAPGSGSPWLVAAIAGSAAVLLVALLGRLPMARLPDRLRRLLALLRIVDLHAFARSILCYVAFFVGSGILGWLVYSWLAGTAEPSLLLGLIAVTLLGWCAGLVVPGAPGGIGVREATMLLLGAPFLERDSLVLAIVLLRVVSLAGEGLLFLLACRLPLHGRAPQPPARGPPSGGELAPRCGDNGYSSSNRSTA